MPSCSEVPTQNISLSRSLKLALRKFMKRLTNFSLMISPFSVRLATEEEYASGLIVIK